MVLRSIYATLVQYLFQYGFTLFISLLIILMDLLRLRRAITPILRFWGGTMIWAMGVKIEVHGREHLDETRTQVLVANHSSTYDIPALYYLLPNSSFIGRDSLMKIPIFKNLLRAIGYIPINPRNLRQSMEALGKGTNTLGKGRSIIIFPEGTRTLNGELGDFKRGFVRILRDTQVPMQPVSLEGLYELKPKGCRFVHYQKKIVLTVHPLVSAEEIKELDDKPLIEKTKSIVAEPLSR